jgi:hypothetical protein
MRDYRDAKAMAHSLRQALKDQSITISHSNAIELVAKAFGFRNWQVLEATIAADAGGPRPIAQTAEADSGPPVLRCSFCGKTQYEVGKLIAGPSVFICDACVGLCNDIVLDEDPGSYIDAQGALSGKTAEDLAAKSAEDLANLSAKAKARLAYARQLLDLVDRIERGAAGDDGEERADPQRTFILRKSPAERAAYATAIRARVNGLEQVAEAVERLLAGGAPPSAA